VQVKADVGDGVEKRTHVHAATLVGEDVAFVSTQLQTDQSFLRVI
jgi:hypothetical protein